MPTCCIYNSTIEGVVSTIDELVAKCPLLAEFKAVQNGDVWCTTQSFFQQSMELADFVVDLHRDPRPKMPPPTCNSSPM